MSPSRRREAVTHVQRDVGVSERRACRALHQPRGTQRYQRRPKADEAVRRSFKATDVLDVLSELMLIRGVPRHIRSDNGPEFIARAIREFLQQTGVQTLYIEPGAPWQNAYAESFNSRFRAEVLSQESFANLAESKQVSDWWKNHYNHRRPHSSLGYVTPAAFAASLAGPALGLGAAPLARATARQAIESADHAPTLIEAGT